MATQCSVRVVCVWLVVGLGSACNGADSMNAATSETVDPEPGVICDGSQGLRVAINQIDGGGGLDPNPMLREIGDYYLYIGGDCKYWVLRPEHNPLVDDTHAGELSPEEEIEFARDFHYAKWSQLKGAYSYALGETPVRHYSDGVNTIVCQPDCSEGQVESRPPEVEGFEASTLAWLSRLKNASSPSTGPMRVAVYFDLYDLGEECTVPWPFAWNPGEFAMDVGEDGVPDAGNGVLMDDTDTVSTLREIRRHYREEVPMYSEGLCEYNWLLGDGTLHFSRGDERFMLVVRDAVPFEDERSTIPLPWPEGD